MGFLAVVIKIAQLPVESIDQLDGIMRTYNQSLNTMDGLICRVWVMKIVELLMKAGLVKCASAEELEAECKGLGNGYSEDCTNCKQPRPVVVSSICNLG